MQPMIQEAEHEAYEQTSDELRQAYEISQIGRHIASQENAVTGKVNARLKR
jgi:hypothetical protein